LLSRPVVQFRSFDRNRQTKYAATVEGVSWVDFRICCRRAASARWNCATAS
jgi:hypothetical protein